jgi:hypothetical protein
MLNRSQPGSNCLVWRSRHRRKTQSNEYPGNGREPAERAERNFMNMSVSSTGSSNSSQNVISNNWQQRRQSFDALSQALQSGDLAGAQQAFSSLSSTFPAGITNDPNSPLAKLGQALKSGNLSAAQSAFAEMRGHKGHHAHHHHHAAAAQSTDPNQINSDSSNPGSTEGLIGSKINITV